MWKLSSERLHSTQEAEMELNPSLSSQSSQSWPLGILPTSVPWMRASAHLGRLPPLLHQAWHSRSPGPSLHSVDTSWVTVQASTRGCTDASDTVPTFRWLLPIMERPDVSIKMQHRKRAVFIGYLLCAGPGSSSLVLHPEVVLLCPFCRCENWGPERLKHLPKMAQLERNLK